MPEMGKLNLASWGLIVGALGQWGFYGRLFPRVPNWAIMMALFLPCYALILITFCNSPPFGPCSFRRCLLAGMCSYAFTQYLSASGIVPVENDRTQPT